MFSYHYFTTLLNRNYNRYNNASSANTCAKCASANISGENLRSTSSPLKRIFSEKNLEN